MSDFFKSRKFKILIAVIALLFGMMLYSASRDGAANIPRNLLSMVTTPFQRAGAFLSEKVGGTVDMLFRARDIEEENGELKEQIAALRQQLVDYNALKEENRQLRIVSGIKSSNPNYEMIPASVISRDADDRFGSFIIDCGSYDDVAVNDPVFTKNGLIGIVTSVGPTSARVRTILSPNTKVGVYEIDTRELGVVQGEPSLAAQGKTKLSILDGDTSIKENAIIVTAGTSGVYPAGIPVGVVEEIRTEAHGITKYAVIRPMESVGDVLDVIVLTGFLGQGEAPLNLEK